MTKIIQITIYLGLYYNEDLKNGKYGSAIVMILVMIGWGRPKTYLILKITLFHASNKHIYEQGKKLMGNDDT